jgi:hypothetical protein
MNKKHLQQENFSAQSLIFRIFLGSLLNAIIDEYSTPLFANDNLTDDT